MSENEKASAPAEDEPQDDLQLGFDWYAEGEVIKGPGEGVPILGHDDKE